MELISSLDFDTHFGLRYVEFLQGDIRELENKTDLLIVSAFKDGYEPMKDTLIGALHEEGINLKDLLKKPELDLREALNCAVTNKIKNPFIQRIMVLEMRSLDSRDNKEQDLKKIFSNLYVTLMVLEKKGYEIRNIMLPLLGTGNQKIDYSTVSKLLTGVTHDMVTELIHLEKITFFDRNREKIEEISKGIKRELGHPDIGLAQDQYTANTRKSTLRKLEKYKLKYPSSSDNLVRASKILSDEKLKAYDLSFAGRVILEYVMTNIHPEADGSLYDRISRLSRENTTPWVISAMHMLRVFGNNDVHYNPGMKASFKTTATDLVLNLICIERVLDFGLEHSKI